MKPISKNAHGVVDYVFAATALLAPKLLGFGRIARTASRSAAVMTLGSSLITDYDLSAVRVLPMKAHLALDGVIVAGLAAAAAATDDDRGRAGLLGMAAVGLTVSALTQTD